MKLRENVSVENDVCFENAHAFLIRHCGQQEDCSQYGQQEERLLLM